MDELVGDDGFIDLGVLGTALPPTFVATYRDDVVPDPSKKYITEGKDEASRSSEEVNNGHLLDQAEFFDIRYF